MLANLSVLLETTIEESQRLIIDRLATLERNKKLVSAKTTKLFFWSLAEVDFDVGAQNGNIKGLTGRMKTRS